MVEGCKYFSEDVCFDFNTRDLHWSMIIICIQTKKMNRGQSYFIWILSATYCVESAKDSMG